MAIIRNIDLQMSGFSAQNPTVTLAVVEDEALDGELALSMEYPPASGPASRDVWCEAEEQDWSRGRAISFRVKSDEPIRLSVSFMDRNRVAYTAWANVSGGQWHSVVIPFSEIRPNPYFQPPGANTEAPLDVSRVERIGFAPQTQAGGRLVITGFKLLE